MTREASQPTLCWFLLQVPALLESLIWLPPKTSSNLQTAFWTHYFWIYESNRKQYKMNRGLNSCYHNNFSSLYAKWNAYIIIHSRAKTVLSKTPTSAGQSMNLSVKRYTIWISSWLHHSLNLLSIAHTAVFASSVHLVILIEFFSRSQEMLSQEDDVRLHMWPPMNSKYLPQWYQGHVWISHS